MGNVTAKAALAPFAHDWVGGDIDGLAQLAGTLYGYGPQITDVAAVLSTQVRQVVGAAGWDGKAASAFTAAWERDSRTAQAVGQAADQVADVVGGLAVVLSQLEARLEQAAAEASAHGVPIGPDGGPPQVCYPGTGGPGQAAAQQWLTEYQRFYQWCMQAAQAARKQAAETLAAMARQIVSSASNRPADIIGSVGTDMDLLYDLLAGDSGPREEDLINAIMKAGYGSGSHTSLGREDDPAAEPGDADPDFGSIGVIDDLAGALSTILNTYEDVHYYHKPLLESLGVESLASEAGAMVPQLPKIISFLAAVDGEPEGEAGGEATGVEVGAEAAEAGVDASDPLALAGVVVDDQIHNAFIEPWGADVREHGVVMGYVDGNANVLKNTVKDLEGNVTEAVEVSLLPEAIEHPKAIGDEVDRIKHAWDDPERALPGGIP
jgi:uncharacterized protein YukE